MTEPSFCDVFTVKGVVRAGGCGRCLTFARVVLPFSAAERKYLFGRDSVVFFSPLFAFVDGWRFPFSRSAHLPPPPFFSPSAARRGGLLS